LALNGHVERTRDVRCEGEADLAQATPWALPVECPKGASNQSGFAPENLTTLAHFSVSPALAIADEVIE
jgi:hypothetical protein